MDVGKKIGTWQNGCVKFYKWNFLQLLCSIMWNCTWRVYFKKMHKNQLNYFNVRFHIAQHHVCWWGSLFTRALELLKTQDHVTTLPCDKYQKMEAETRLVIMCNPILSCQCHCAHVTCVGCQWGHEMSAFIQQKQSRSQSSLKKRKKKEKIFSLIANVTSAVTQWHSRPPRLFSHGVISSLASVD